MGDVKYDDKDKNGCSVLMYACSGGYKLAVEKLIGMMPESNREEILNYNTKGVTALRVAAEKENEELVKYLIRQGASDIGDLKGDKMNKCMMWWGELDREKTVVNKVSAKEKSNEI